MRSSVRQTVDRGRSRVRDLKADGQLVLRVVGTFICLQKYLDSKGADATPYTDAMNGRRALAITESRRGRTAGRITSAQLHLPPVVRTAHRPPQPRPGRQYGDMPGNEVRMWYNPDER